MELKLQVPHGLKYFARQTGMVAAKIKRPRSGAIESGDIGSLVADRCSEGEPSEEHILRIRR